MNDVCFIAVGYFFGCCQSRYYGKVRRKAVLMRFISLPAEFANLWAGRRLSSGMTQMAAHALIKANL